MDTRIWASRSLNRTERRIWEAVKTRQIKYDDVHHCWWCAIDLGAMAHRFSCDIDAVRRMLQGLERKRLLRKANPGSEFRPWEAAYLLFEFSKDCIRLELAARRTAVCTPTRFRLSRRFIQMQVLMLKSNQCAIKQKPAYDGYVYLIKAASGHYKIGRSANVDDRIRTFEVKLPMEIRLEHVIPCRNMRKAESELHKRFKRRRVNGEWFDLTHSEVYEIKAIQEL